jgi:hypothetical protein
MLVGRGDVVAHLQLTFSSPQRRLVKHRQRRSPNALPGGGGPTSSAVMKTIVGVTQV